MQWAECAICQRCLFKQVMKPITESVNSQMPPTTEWWVVKKRLDMLQQRVQLLLHLTENDKQVHSTFCADLLGMIPDNENLK